MEVALPFAKHYPQAKYILFVRKQQRPKMEYKKK
jgi:hypothetical protein